MYKQYLTGSKGITRAFSSLTHSIGIITAVIVAVSYLSASAQNPSEGWRPLFNHVNWDGWYTFNQSTKKDDVNKIFEIQDSVIHIYKHIAHGKNAPAGYFATKKSYSRYHLRFEFKWGTKKFGGRANKPRDSGVLYHMEQRDRVWPHSVEYQIQENDVGDVWTVHGVWCECAQNPEKEHPTKWNKAGGGGISRYRKSVTNEIAGDWNLGEAIIMADSVVYIINGVVNNRCRNLRHKVNGKMVPMVDGKILFQAEWAEVLYRNIYIKELDEFGNPISATSLAKIRLKNTGRNQASQFSHGLIPVFNLLDQKMPRFISKKQTIGHLKVEWNTPVYATGVYIYNHPTVK